MPPSRDGKSRRFFISDFTLQSGNKVKFQQSLSSRKSSGIMPAKLVLHSIFPISRLSRAKRVLHLIPPFLNDIFTGVLLTAVLKSILIYKNLLYVSIGQQSFISAERFSSERMQRHVALYNVHKSRHSTYAICLKKACCLYNLHKLIKK